MLEALMTALITALAGLVVRYVSNQRVKQLQAELDARADVNIGLERDNYCLRQQLARHGIAEDHPLALPKNEEVEA